MRKGRRRGNADEARMGKKKELKGEADLPPNRDQPEGEAEHGPDQKGQRLEGGAGPTKDYNSQWKKKSRS